MKFKKFDQFKPQSFADIQKQQQKDQTQTMKEFADYLKEELPKKLQEKMNFLRDNHSGTYRIDEDTWNWTNDTTFYNEQGNDIRFFTVYGNRNRNEISMEMRTHDTIFGDFGNDQIHAGWGNDIVFGGDLSPSHTSIVDSDEMYGGAGNDVLIAFTTDLASGQEGRDTLIGHSGSHLKGGSSSDTFVINIHQNDQLQSQNDDYQVPEILDLTTEDKLIINFPDGAGFGGATSRQHLHGANTTIITTNGDDVVMLRNAELAGFELEPNHDGSVVTITGSDFA